MIVITVARKPLSGTVAETVLMHGCGAINVDASRIRTGASEPDSGAMYYKNRGLPMPSNRQNYFQGGAREVRSVPIDGGRWPANLVLGHMDGCRQEGTKRVTPANGSRRASARSQGFRSTFVGGDPKVVGANLNGGLVDPEGKETVAVWHCVGGCPVAALDAQSGVQQSKIAVQRHGGGQKIGVNAYMGSSRTPDDLMRDDVGYGDTGGASRFFKQVGGSR